MEEFLGEETPIEKLFKLMDKNRDGFITKKVKRIFFQFPILFKTIRNSILSARNSAKIRFDVPNIKVV